MGDPTDAGAIVTRARRSAERFDAALERLAAAKPFAKATHQTDVFQAADSLLATDEGIRALYERAPRLEEAGAFAGGPWADPAKLLPPLVRGGLEAGGIYPVLESMSELRVLAIVKGHGRSDRIGPRDGRAFLEEVLALNLDLLFPAETEASRAAFPSRDKAERLMRLIGEELGLDNLLRVVLEEIEQVCQQRPIMTDRVLEMIRTVERIPAERRLDLEGLQRYVDAVRGPTELARRHPQPAAYRAALRALDPEGVLAEVEPMARALRETGIGSVHHTILLRRLRSAAPEQIADALGLNALGRAELDQNRELVHDLIKVAILPATATALYGFAGVLERGLLSRTDVAAGLRRLVDLDLCAKVKRNLLSRRRTADGVTANSLLVAGALAVLGQPLGIGQGKNPTCQAARGISLWSQHAPGFLLDLLASAARDDLIQVRFEGDVLVSNRLSGGLAGEVDLDLDPVSVVLVPHLDRVYDEMMRRVAYRHEDGHKWANPGLYGRWVQHGFASPFDKATGRVTRFGDFVRRFYATHHPAYNDGHELIYPNPVGIFVTNNQGELLGLHAVSIQRIGEDPQGALRVYFFNPNNEGRQDWGQEICPSIARHGEQEGESSLPFAQFAARLYAFHYNPFEEGDAYAVPPDTVAEIERLARDSWGRSYMWTP